MTYQPTKPQGGDIPSISRGDIQQNFAVLNSVFSQNHYEYDYSIAADRGKHRYVTYLDQTPSGDPAVAGTDWATFVKKTTFGAVSAPFIRNNTKVWNMPVVIEVADKLTVAGAWNDLFDFAGQPKMMGIIFLIDTGTPDRTIMSNFAWDGTTISVPTNLLLPGGSRTKSFRDSNYGGILSTGDDMTSLKFDDITPDTSMLQIWTNVAINKVRTRILGVLI